jgi:HNH endonuclease
MAREILLRRDGDLVGLGATVSRGITKVSTQGSTKMPNEDPPSDEKQINHGRRDEDPFKEPPETLKILVWDKGRPIPGFDAAMWRYDVNRYVMKYENYGIEIRDGWEIDHIVPPSKGGTNVLSNLQPLQWQNRRRKDNRR